MQNKVENDCITELVCSESKKLLVDDNFNLLQKIRNLTFPYCTRPWTTIEERDESHCIAPCWGTDYTYAKSITHGDELAAVWQGESVRGLRKAMVEKQGPVFCRPECPVLSHRELWFDEFEIIPFSKEELANFSVPFLENRKKAFEAIINQKTEADYFPLHLKVYPSNKCNLKCIMCFNDLSSFYEKNWYTEELIEHYATYLEFLDIYGGEPFCCELSKKYIFYKNYPDNVCVTFLTNGTLLTEKIIEQLASVRLGNIAISLDACTAGVYEKIRAPARFDKTIKNIKNFVNLRNHHPLRSFNITANFVIQELNYLEIPRFIEFCHEMEMRPGFSYIWENENARKRAEQMNEEYGRFPKDINALYESLEKGIEKAEELGDMLVVEKAKEAKFYLELRHKSRLILID